MKTLVLLIGALALAYAFLALKKEVVPQTQPQKQASFNPANVTPTATPFRPVVPVVYRSGVFCLQGKIAKVTPVGVIFESEEWTPPANPWMNFQANASDGAGDIARMAKLAAGHDQDAFQKRYGVLLEVQNGTYQKAAWTPTSKAHGRVFLCGLPGSALEGRRMLLAAAPTGQSYNGAEVYSAVYKPKTLDAKLRSGITLRAVTVIRWDADGVVLKTQGNAVKVYNDDLTPELYQELKESSR